MTESHENNAEDEIVIDLGRAVTGQDEHGEETTTITNETLAQAVREARNGAGQEYLENVDSPPRDIRIRVHSW